MTLQDYITTNGITATIKDAANNPNMDLGPDASHYRITLKYGRRRLTVPFSCGSLAGYPTCEGVLDCLASDATCPDTFEDFCSEYGYDTDSRKAEQTFKACCAVREKMKSFLGADFDAVVFGMERL